MRVLRIKAVSECMRIRRASLIYVIEENKTVDLSSTKHPLKKFGSLTIQNQKITCNEKTEELGIEEIYFYKNSNVDSGAGIELERSVLGVLPLELAEEAIPYYKKAIEDGYVFDQWNGEFDYILGLIYEFTLKNDEEAKKWYSSAEAKKFVFRLMEENHNDVI